MISADAGVSKFLIGWAVMSNLLACILACISERQIWYRHQGNVFYWHKLLKTTLKPELEPTIIACLAGKDAQEVLYTGFVQSPSGDSQDRLFHQNIYRFEWTSKWFVKRELKLWLKNIRWGFWQLFIILLSLFASQAGDCSGRCGLPAFSKVLERVMYNRLLRFLNNHNILYDNQYGFRRHHSTTYALAC